MVSGFFSSVVVVCGHECSLSGRNTIYSRVGDIGLQWRKRGNVEGKTRSFSQKKKKTFTYFSYSRKRDHSRLLPPVLWRIPYRHNHPPQSLQFLKRVPDSVYMEAISSVPHYNSLLFPQHPLHKKHHRRWKREKGGGGERRARPLVCSQEN